jgi:hypothetical protein
VTSAERRLLAAIRRKEKASSANTFEKNRGHLTQVVDNSQGQIRPQPPWYAVSEEERENSGLW